jgi:hypothetical protein
MGHGGAGMAAYSMSAVSCQAAGNDPFIARASGTRMTVASGISTEPGQQVDVHR